MDRNEIINWLVANSDTWTKPGDRDILAALPDAKLQDLRKHTETHVKAVTVANAAVHGFADGGKQFRLNPETGAWEQRIVENAAPMKEKKKGKAEPDMEEEEEEEEEELEVNAKTPPRRQKPQTLEDFINSAPAEVQNMLRTAQAVEQREKDKIITDLLVNVAESEREAHRQRLMTRSIEELANDRALMPKVAKTEELKRATEHGGFGQVANFAERDNDDMLMPQTIDWAPVANGKDAKEHGQQTQHVNNDHGGGGFDDQWLQSAPNKIKVAVKNAMAIEQREKDKIISEIVANIADEAAERRMVARLRTKSLEELRELAVLAPKKEPAKRPNYFGSSVPAPGATVHNSSEDVLPLPRMEWEK